MLSEQRDIFVVLIFALVVLMMVLPLPPGLMDVMIVLNISAAVVILLMSVQTISPLQFSTFPSILLVTTLFRLSISISTTRLILLTGDAGQVIQTFGKVVVGGNLIVGLVIFLIISVVQFLVITKGADRVAEVGARFTLDGMPGKQMSVDADVRAGNMDHQDATDARRALEQEAKLFGAMDGAMKFVKGDAIAGLIITVINLLGGITIGMLQHGQSFGQAAQVYSLLTVGDGLVAQIPALMISIAAGTMVTRVTSRAGLNLGFEIVQQFIGNSRTIVTAGALIVLFGFVPGFPKLVFFTVGSGMMGSVLLMLQRKKKSTSLMNFDWKARIEARWEKQKESRRRGVRTDIVSLELPTKICIIDVDQFCYFLDATRDSMSFELGLPASEWLFEINWKNDLYYRIFIGTEEVACAEFRSDYVFVKAHPSYLKALGIECLVAYGLREGALVSKDAIPALDKHKVQYWSAFDSMLLHLRRVVVEHASAFADSQGTHQMLDALAIQHPVLVSALRDAVPNSHVSKILQMLLEERIPITSRTRITEAILRWSEKGLEGTAVLQKVRNELSEFITRRFAPDGFLQVIVIAPTIESLIREGIRATNEGSFLLLEPTLSAHIASQVRALLGGEYQRGKHPVLLTQQDTRFPLFTLLFEQGIYVPVLAYSEIMPATVVYPVGVVAPDEQSAAE